jgi:hypothetical protein
MGVLPAAGRLMALVVMTGTGILTALMGVGVVRGAVPDQIPRQIDVDIPGWPIG